MAMNNETGGKPTPMTFKGTPLGGTDANSTKPGSGAPNAATRYRVDNSYYNMAGAPTLGKPMGDVEEDASTKKPKRLVKISGPGLGSGTSAARN